MIRPARSSDLFAVGRIHARSRHVAYQGIVADEALTAGSAEAMAHWWAERWAHERDTHRLTVAVSAEVDVALPPEVDDDGPVDVIVEEAPVLGFTYVGPSGSPGVGELYAIHVDPDYQGRGIGSGLLGDALGTLADLGYERAVLWVLRENRQARGFYERGGWVFDGAVRDSAIGSAVVPQVRYTRPLSGLTGRV